MVTLMDNELYEIQQAQLGDAASFARLTAHYRGWLLAMAFMRTSDREASEDLTQEVLVHAWEKLPTLENLAVFAGWLQRSMINACISWHRRRGRWSFLLEEDDLSAPTALEPPAVLIRDERQREIRQALLTLAPSNRLALLMHLWGDYSYAEIAHLLQVSVTTVDGRIYRAKQQLRRLLREKSAELLNEPRRQWRRNEGKP